MNIDDDEGGQLIFPNNDQALTLINIHAAVLKLTQHAFEKLKRFFRRQISDIN